ncbi:MAG: hypothetical protein IT223_02075 [Crocinitomicaceae bacterium]|nr:hypothetical protein [Crocinitomicaceae bacterium]
MEIIAKESGKLGSELPARSQSLQGQVVKVLLASFENSGTDANREVLFRMRWVMDVYDSSSRHLFNGFAVRSFLLKLESREKIWVEQLFSLSRQLGEFFNEESKRSDAFIAVRNLDYLLSADDFEKGEKVLHHEVERWTEAVEVR